MPTREGTVSRIGVPVALEPIAGALLVRTPTAVAAEYRPAQLLGDAKGER